MSEMNVWDKYWTAENANPTREDPMCLFLALVVQSEFEKIAGKKPTSAIEMGAGSGRTSRYLNEMGSVTGILDLSEEALKLARFANTNAPRETFYFHQNLFEVSRESIGQSFDIVWNAGVLEHFTAEQQKKMLAQMGTVLNPSGLMMLLCPYSGSLLYRLGKWVLEKLGRFPYGEENPVTTLAEVMPPTLHIVTRERSVGFVILIFNGFKALANIPGLGAIGTFVHQNSSRFFVSLLKNPVTRTCVFVFDRLMSRILGGYLILTTCSVT